jgi:FkbM family methyltransferase
LKRFSPSVSPELRIAKILNHKKIDTVIDIGANTGQFAESLYDFGFEGKVISFEPGSKAHRELSKRSRKYKGWTAAEPCAIGAKPGKLELNISANSVFSSLLTINTSHVKQKTDSRIIETETVKVYRLDDIIDEYISTNPGKILLKIDTQGYEKEVLEGAQNTLKRISGIKIEIPLFPIYENTGFTFYEILEFLKQNEYHPYNFEIEGVDYQTGKVNTIDGLFFRS